MARNPSIRFDDDTLEAIDEDADEAGKNRSERVREAVKRDLNRTERRARDILATVGGYSLFMALVMVTLSRPDLAGLLAGGASVPLGGAAWLHLTHGD